MQLAVRFAATLSAVTWTTSGGHAARRTVHQQPAQGVDLIKLRIEDESGDLPSYMPAEIGKAPSIRRTKHKLRALAHIFYLNSAKASVSQRVDSFAHSSRDRPVDQALRFVFAGLLA
jgi:hypothetical protein